MPSKIDRANNQTAYFRTYDHYGVNSLGVYDVEERFLIFLCRIARILMTHCRSPTLDVTKFCEI